MHLTNDQTPAVVRQHMNGTGIGFAGIKGAWWLPAAQPFTLPHQAAADLARYARAIFLLFDMVADMYGTPMGAACGLGALLEERVPAAIPRLHGCERVLGVRPDFQLQPLAQHGPTRSSEEISVSPCLRGENPRAYRLVATELEICPSAQGFAHAMQLGYGLPTDLADTVAELLRGRELLFVGSSAWSEFLFEQLAFCRALAERGARGRVLFDLPLAEIARRVRAGLLWRPPLFGIDTLPAVWGDDLLARVEAAGLMPYLFPDAAGWPEQVGDALVFRFGYFDCFAREQLERMRQWQEHGATFLNPTSFIFDSKVVMAALGIPALRVQIAAVDPAALTTLDACIPETILVRPQELGRLRREQAGWVIKYAGYDHDNQAWGGRSLQVGAALSPAVWDAALRRCLDLPWPVVAQRAAHTARIDIAYVDARDQPQVMRQGATRLRCFMFRDDLEPDARQVRICGAHLTVSGRAERVSESTDSVQAPVAWR